jgi:adenylate cyclase
VHLEAGGHAERAVPHLEEVATRALRRGAHREAVGLLERAVAILDSLPRTPERALRTIRLCITLGSALLPGGLGDPRLHQVNERARRLSEESDDPVQLFQVLVSLTGIYAAQARFDRARETAQQLERLLETMPIPPFVFAGSLFIAMVQYHSGSLAEARVLLERAVALEDVPLPPLATDLHAMARGYLALTLVHQGCPDQARTLVRSALARSSAEIRPFDHSLALNFACMVDFLLRDYDDLARTADAVSALVDFPAAVALGRMSHGRVLSARGEHPRAIAAMREGIDAFRAESQQVALPLLIAALAECHAAAGEEAAAFACVAAARSAAEEVGEIRYLAELHRLEGELHAAAGDRPQAERCFRRAIELAREQGARWWELRATTSAAQVALARGTRAPVRSTERETLEALVATFSEGADTRDLQDARRVLAALA